MRPSQFGLAYLATPYSLYQGGLERAWVDACKFTAGLIAAGIRVYSPIAFTHGVAIHGGLDPLDLDLWLPFDETMMAKADSLIVARMQGWDTSKGIAHEIQVFADARKPIFDLDPETLKMVRRG